MRITVAQHHAAIQALLAPLASRPAEPVPLTAAPGRVLDGDTVSPIDLPVFANSQMDGYALAAASLTAVPARLPVSGVLAAGMAAIPLQPGSAIKIMTGAPIPAGADCVVPVEDTELGDSIVTILRSRTAGEFVRQAGSDVRAGQPLVLARTTLASRHIAALAAAGVHTVQVRPRVRAAVITTGDELIAPGTPLGPGQIYNSNGPALAAALREAGADVVSVSHSIDDIAVFRALLMEAAAHADVVFTSGGVSMGDFEVVRETLTPLGGVFGHVAMQPGGPQGLSTIASVPVLSFPGNPVSTLVSFAVFARNLLRELAGLTPVEPELAPLQTALRSPAGKTQFLRGERTPAGVLPAQGAGSHLVASMARADVLIEVPAQTTGLVAGDDVQVWPL